MLKGENTVSTVESMKFSWLMGDLRWALEE